VTNWFTTADDKMKVFSGGKDIEPYSAEYWKMVGELASKLHECYTNVILVSPLQHIEFSEKSGKYSFDYKNFDRVEGYWLTFSDYYDSTSCSIYDRNDGEQEYYNCNDFN
jgi:hypothetical protein